MPIVNGALGRLRFGAVGGALEQALAWVARIRFARALAKGYPSLSRVSARLLCRTLWPRSHETGASMSHNPRWIRLLNEVDPVRRVAHLAPGERRS